EHVVEKDVAADANAPAEPLEIVLRSLVRMVAVDQHQVDLARIHLDRVRVAQEQLDVQAEALAELPRLHIERGGPLSEEVSLLLADVDRPELRARPHRRRDRHSGAAAPAPDLDRLLRPGPARRSEDVSDLPDRHADDAVVQRRAGEETCEVLELERALRSQIERDGREAGSAVERRPNGLEDRVGVALEHVPYERLAEALRRYGTREASERVDRRLLHGHGASSVRWR